MKTFKEKQSLVEEMCSPLVSLKEGNYKAGIMQFLSEVTFRHNLIYSWLKEAPQWLYTWRLAHLDYKEIPQGLFTKQSLIKNALGNGDYFIFIWKGHLFFALESICSVFSIHCQLKNSHQNTIPSLYFRPRPEHSLTGEPFKCARYCDITDPV